MFLRAQSAHNLVPELLVDLRQDWQLPLDALSLAFSLESLALDCAVPHDGQNFTV